MINVLFATMPYYAFPRDYDHIPKTRQEEILRWFKNHAITAENHARSRASGLAQEVRRQMREKMVDLAAEGIYVGFDAVGHRGEYFLITDFDAEMDYDLNLEY